MSLPYMPIYWGDFLRDTAHLSACEIGAYLLLIGHYWCHGGLPRDDESLAQICRLQNGNFTATIIKIRPFFDAEMKHKRIEKELNKARVSHDRRAAAGRKRWNINGVEHSICNAYAMHEHISKKESKEVSKKEIKRAAPKGPLSENYVPNATTLRVAKEEGLSEEALRRTTETMRAWAVANGVRRVDWNAQHQNWIRREAERRGNVKPDKSAYAAAERLVERVQRSVDEAYAPVRPLLSVTSK